MYVQTKTTIVHKMRLKMGKLPYLYLYTRWQQTHTISSKSIRTENNEILLAYKLQS